MNNGVTQARSGELYGFQQLPENFRNSRGSCLNRELSGSKSLKSRIIGKFPVTLKPRELNTLVDCSKRLTAEHPVKVSFQQFGRYIFIMCQKQMVLAPRGYTPELIQGH